MLVHPKPALTSPLGLAVGSVGKVQLVVGFGGGENGAGRINSWRMFFFLFCFCFFLEKLRFTCAISKECIGCVFIVPASRSPS